MMHKWSSAFAASIPSPQNNVIELGPLKIHYYGVIIGIGVVLAVMVMTRRYERYGGDKDLAERVLMWAIGLGFLGARLAYVLPRFATVTADGLWHVFAIWEGGLALYGGLTTGFLVAVLMFRHYEGDTPAILDAAAIGIPLAQGIGRWGNYFNQELFGTPSDLPWAVEIAERFRPSEYADSATFHPAFLYESLWNLAVVIPIVLWIERRFDLRKGNLFWIYVMLYGFARFMLEFIRTDRATVVLGFRANQLVAALLMATALSVFVMRQRSAVPSGEQQL